MHAIDDLILVGMSQRTAPVAVREQYAVTEGDATALLHQLQQGGLLDEGVILSTCNRTEILASTADGTQGAMALHGALFRNADPQHVYSYRGVEAIMHLFRVASGLDSLVLGETEILGQLKRSLEAGLTGRLLTPLYEQAITVGKRVRRETSIGEGSLSVARVGIEVAARAIGRFDRSRAIVVGAGETGMLVAVNLTSAGIKSLCLMNRTPERSAEAAAQLGGAVESMGLERLTEQFESADLAVVCVDGAQPLVEAASLDRKALSKRDQPLVVLDLSVPRAVDPEVAALDGVILYDLDALLPVVEEHRASRAAAAEEVTPILISEVHKFLSLRTFAAFTPAIEELKSGFAEERERLLDQMGGGPSARELELAHAMERQLLHLALSQLKESARQTQSTATLERAYLRFVNGLPSDAD